MWDDEEPTAIKAPKGSTPNKYIPAGVNRNTNLPPAPNNVGIGIQMNENFERIECVRAMRIDRTTKFDNDTGRTVKPHRSGGHT